MYLLWSRGHGHGKAVRGESLRLLPYSDKHVALFGGAEESLTVPGNLQYRDADA